jgi:hypothetical protein
MKTKTTIAMLVMLATVFPVECKQKPKAPFTLAISAEHTTVKAGEPVVVDVVKTNTSGHTMNVSQSNNPAENYSIDVKRDGIEAEKTADAKKMKDESGHRTMSLLFDNLKAGKVMNETLEVSAYRDMSEPGTYAVQLEQKLSPTIVVASNTITVTVE